jgi:hypothetical protein
MVYNGSPSLITYENTRLDTVERTVANITVNPISFSSSVTAAGNITTNGSFVGTLATPSQPNVTTVGTLGNLTVSGNISCNRISGTVTTPAQPQITSVGSLSSLNVGGSTNVGSLSSGGTIEGNILRAFSQIAMAAPGGNGDCRILAYNGTCLHNNNVDITYRGGAFFLVSAYNTGGNQSYAYGTLYRNKLGSINRSGSAPLIDVRDYGNPTFGVRIENRTGSPCFWLVYLFTDGSPI